MPRVKFEFHPDDSEVIKLSTALMNRIAAPFNDWLLECTELNATAKDTTGAAVMALATELAMTMNACSTPGAEAAYIDVVTKAIHRHMTRLHAAGVAQRSKEPDASIN